MQPWAAPVLILCAPDFANCTENTGSNSISRAASGGAGRNDIALPVSAGGAVERQQ